MSSPMAWPPRRWLARSVIALAAGLMPAVTVAQDAADYVPLGPFHQWELSDGTDALVLKVTNKQKAGGFMRYSVSLPSAIGTASMILGYQGDALYLYGFRADVDGNTLTVPIKPPALLGQDGMVFGTDTFTTTVNTTFGIKVKLGFFKVSVDVDVTGTVTASWFAHAPVATTSGTYPAGRLNISADLHFSADELGYQVEQDAQEDFDLVFGEGVGFVSLTLGGSDYLLDRAILSGSTIGDFPPNQDLEDFSFPVAGLFKVDGGQLITLHGAADSASIGGDYLLTDVTLQHTLKGKLFLDAMVAPAGAPSEAVAIHLKGKCKVSRKTGLARLRLRGKAKLSSLNKPLAMKVKVTLDGSPTTLDITYASKGIVPGTTSLNITPVVSSTAVVTLTGVVDTKLHPGNPRKMQSNGTLTVGTVDFPIRLVEVMKTHKSTGLKKRGYKLREDGFKAKVLRIRASSTDITDYTLHKFRGRLLGLPVKFLSPDTEVIYSVSP